MVSLEHSCCLLLIGKDAAWTHQGSRSRMNCGLQTIVHSRSLYWSSFWPVLVWPTLSCFKVITSQNSLVSLSYFSQSTLLMKASMFVYTIYTPTTMLFLVLFFFRISIFFYPCPGFFSSFSSSWSLLYSIPEPQHTLKLFFLPLCSHHLCIYTFFNSILSLSPLISMSFPHPSQYLFLLLECPVL